MSTKTPKKKNTFFKDYDLYSDANPKDTVRIKYDTLDNTKKTINKIERMYKNNKITHSRASQIANVMSQRLRVINKNDSRTKLAFKYFNFLKLRTKANEKERKRMTFK
mgnify:CR=1 FL=1|jgi:hypothetical protein|tara:strand:+ start:750 stop:1073 length:324 start_codon:yes stop_codon:yes gene_type:complete